MRNSEAAGLVAVLVAAYPAGARGRKIQPETCVVYETFLLDFKVSDISLVIDSLIKTSKWFPTISEIRSEAIRVRIGAPTTAGALAEISAYNEHYRKAAGAASKPQVHPLVRKALEVCGGLSTFRKTTSPSVWQSQFRKAYEEFVADTCFEENVRTDSARLSGRIVLELEGHCE